MSFCYQKGRCQFNKSKVKATVSGYRTIQQSETALKEAVANVGPVSVAIDASQKSFQSYRGGTESPYILRLIADRKRPIKTQQTFLKRFHYVLLHMHAYVQSCVTISCKCI